MKKIQCEPCPVRFQNVICNLAPEALDDFRAASTSAFYKPRQVIFNEGAPAAGVYLICHGAVKLYNSDRFGRDHIFEIAGPGAVLGELPLNTSQGLSISAEAVCESQLRFLAREALVHFVEKYPATGVRLIAALSTELAMARRKVRDLALKGAESRLASLLVQLANGQLSRRQRLHLRYKRSEIAEMIGVSTETAIRLLGRLHKKRLIQTDGRDVVIVDAERVARVANHDEIDA